MPFDPPAPIGTFALVATRRFLREAEAFRRKYNPAFDGSLRAFCRFRAEAAPTEPFNTKDGRMGGALSHLRRCHLVHGKAVAIYATAGRVVRLIALVEHDGLEGRAVPEIAAYVRALGTGDFEPAAALFDDPEVAALRAEVMRLRAQVEAHVAERCRLERDAAEAWALAEEEAVARTRAEADLARMRGTPSAAPPPASPPTPAGLGARLLVLRGAHGLTQADVARASGLSQPQVSLCERGAKVPDYVTGALEAWALAAACGPAARRTGTGAVDAVDAP